jgi:hypothetical protein
MFMFRFGGFAAKTNQKLGFGAQPQDFGLCISRAVAKSLRPLGHTMRVV